MYGSTRWRRHVHERVPCKMPDKSSLKPLWADSVSKMVPERGLESPAKPQLKSSMVLCLKHSFSPGWGKKGAAGQPRLTLLHPSLFQPTNHSASQTMRSKLCASCFGSESQNTIKFWQVFWWWWSHSALATKKLKWLSSCGLLWIYDPFLFSWSSSTKEKVTLTTPLEPY